MFQDGGQDVNFSCLHVNNFFEISVVTEYDDQLFEYDE